MQMENCILECNSVTEKLLFGQLSAIVYQKEWITKCMNQNQRHFIVNAYAMA